MEQDFQFLVDGGVLVFVAGLFQRGQHLHPQQVEGFGVAAAELAAEDRLRRHSVPYRPSGNGPYVKGGLFVEPALGQLIDYFRGDPDGRKAFLRLHAGMSGPSFYSHVETHVRRTCTGDGVHRAVPIKHHRLFRQYHRVVHVSGPDNTDFLAAGEHDLHRAAGQSFVYHGFQSFQDSRDSRLAVAAQNGGAVGNDAVALNPWLDTPSRLHGVHVGRQKQWIVPLFRGNDVSMGVPGHAKPQALQPAGQILGYFLLFVGGTVDAHQLAKGVDESFLIGHQYILAAFNEGCAVGGKHPGGLGHYTTTRLYRGPKTGIEKGPRRLPGTP